MSTLVLFMHFGSHRNGGKAIMESKNSPPEFLVEYIEIRPFPSNKNLSVVYVLLLFIGARENVYMSSFMEKFS